MSCYHCGLEGPCFLDHSGAQVLEERREHCTHPEQKWCDCDWCRYLCSTR